MKRKIGRTLYNKLCGRPEFEGQPQMDYQAILGALDYFRSVRGRCHHGKYQFLHPTKGFPPRKVDPEKAYLFFSRVFKPTDLRALQFKPMVGTHENYYGSRNEKHYIEVLAEVRNKIQKKDGKFEENTRRTQRLTIEFLVDRK